MSACCQKSAVPSATLELEEPRDKNSNPEVFCKKGVLENFAKFTEKHLRQSLGRRVHNLLKLKNILY